MKPALPSPAVSFDQFAGDYDSALQQGLAVSGEEKSFFARGRVAWLARCLESLGCRPRTVIDFGCGTGTSIPLFFELLGAREVIGVDVSAASLAVAAEKHGAADVQFMHLDDWQPVPTADLVFCNGVFHHIPPARRRGTVERIFGALRPGGLFALWENNPYNPGTRLVMSRIPFDRDAIMVWPGEANRLLQSAGFTVVKTDFQFIFPRMLKGLRFMEPWLSRLPLGAQYQVLGRK
jgi:SAM-dependent methyltransferase